MMGPRGLMQMTTGEQPGNLSLQTRRAPLVVAVASGTDKMSREKTRKMRVYSYADIMLPGGHVFAYSGDWQPLSGLRHLY